MGSVGFGEVAFLVVLALLLFGPDKLPGIASTVGRAVGAVRREASGTLDELKRAAELEDLRGVARELQGARDDLRGARDGVRRGLTGASATAAGARAGATQASSGPPPFDPDAT